MELSKEDYNELVVNVYSCEGRISSSGYISQRGMINFNYEGFSQSCRGRSSLLVKLVALSLGNSLCKKSGINRIRFNFPEVTDVLPIFLDGYFGRPMICTGATFLKPLSSRRKIALAKNINKISKIKDKWGKEVKLIA